MGDFGNAIKYLYQNFILRDVLSFITPGTIVVLTTFILLKEPSLDELLGYSTSMHWLLYIPLFGIFYAVGFSLQCFGEIIGLVQFWPDVKPSCSDRRRIFTPNWRDTSNPLSMEAKFKNLSPFWKAIKEDEEAGLGRERLVVFKQMCANVSLAIVIGGILLAVNWFPWSYAKLCIILLLTVLILVSLFWGHRTSLLVQHTREQAIISEAEDSSNK